MFDVQKIEFPPTGVLIDTLGHAETEAVAALLLRYYQANNLSLDTEVIAQEVIRWALDEKIHEEWDFAAERLWMPGWSEFIDEEWFDGWNRRGKPSDPGRPSAKFIEAIDRRIAKDADRKTRARIDAMTRTEMASLWWFAPAGDPLFAGETGEYFQKRFKELGGFSPQISKDIGLKP